MKNYYYILGISQDATEFEIKKAYRKLSLKFHPDINNGDNFFEERFKDINEAYENLTDSSKRKEHDNTLFGNYFEPFQNGTSSQQNREEEQRQQEQKRQEELRRQERERQNEKRRQHQGHHDERRQKEKNRQELSYIIAFVGVFVIGLYSKHIYNEQKVGSTIPVSSSPSAIHQNKNPPNDVPKYETIERSDPIPSAAPHLNNPEEKLSSTVQIPAEFPGGITAWTRYLEWNLNRDIPFVNGAPAGRYTVIVAFTVSNTGAISDVQAENDPGYGTKAEAIRVIVKGPSWKPAVENGINVIYRHKKSITFVVNED